MYPPIAQAPFDPSCLEGTLEWHYRIPHWEVEFHQLKVPIPTSVLRTTGYGPNLFAIESLIDELAHRARQDPYLYRRELLAGNTRAMDVLDLAAEKSNWRQKPAPGHFRGIAFAEAFRTMTAHVVELSVRGRLISPAEGLNTRRSLDGARLTVKLGAVVWNATALRLVKSLPVVFNDVPDHAQSIWGTGFTAPHPVWKRANMSLYYFGLDRQSSIFRKGIGREIRHTIGSRSFKTARRWDFNYEAIVQWGSFTGRPIRAWALSEDTGYTFSDSRLRPRIGIRADVASGDGGAHARSFGSFNPLFPAAPVYSGPSGLLGPTNLIDLTPSLKVQLKRVSLTLESSSFWRESVQDGIYSPSVAAAPPVRRGETSLARYVATAPSATLSYQATRHMFVTTTYTRFLAGRFLKESPPNRDVNYVASWITYRF